MEARPTVKEAKPEVGARTEAKSTAEVGQKTAVVDVAPSEKGTGRNSDGTFAKGNTYGRYSGGGTASEISVRTQAKIRAAEDPHLIQDLIDTLLVIAKNPDHPKCTEAIDKLIKLLGNYDPAETKADVTGNLGAELKTSPLSQLTRKDLLKLLKRDK